MSVLLVELRRRLERSVVEGRLVADRGAAAAVARLGVASNVAPAWLSEDERSVRVALRARARQLGDVQVDGGFPNGCRLLVGEVAYEQWHRILFARFLAENNLLIHPEYGVPVSLAECVAIAEESGEQDGWLVAARFAGQILPGIFRLEDPAVRVRLAPEDLLGLERIVTELPVEVFTAEDSLGWVYQFWQSKAKEEVNKSGRKIGGADLAPVTQLFTEDYMVRFLLENSLGAWWAGKFPDSPLLAGFKFLRFGEDGKPAAGTFDGWPTRVADVTVMDPCCGSGHFLVAAFGMLWRMRAEAEGLAPADAQDAVLRDNLFGLELDPRCTQIAMFALALEAWKQGGYRVLPVPNVACSGIPAKAPVTEWTKLAGNDVRLAVALNQLHSLFADADTLGSLIDPRRAIEEAGLAAVDWGTLAPLLDQALTNEAARSGDPAAEVFGNAAAGVARAAQLLTRTYTLAITNPPYLAAGKQNDTLRAFLSASYESSRADLATAMLARLRSMSSSTCSVSPDKLLYLSAYKTFRRALLADATWQLIGLLGARGFSTPMFDLGVLLGIWTWSAPRLEQRVSGIDVADLNEWEVKSDALMSRDLSVIRQSDQLGHPDSRFSLVALERAHPFLSAFAASWTGLQSSDDPRCRRFFWEFPRRPDCWVHDLSAPTSTAHTTGRNAVLGLNHLAVTQPGTPRGSVAWGRRSIVVRLMGQLHGTLYDGPSWNQTAARLVPGDEQDLPAIWSYLISGEFEANVRQLDRKTNVTPATLAKVPFDVERWRAVAAEEFPDGLPEPHSDDPTQWLFRGVPAGSMEPLQVAAARLVGFSWPDQEPDAIDDLVDGDGIVCLPPVAGEQPAVERVRAVLASSYGEEWSTGKLDELLLAAGGKPGDLEGWLRDVFFKHHCRVFQNRPFVWQVWDGRADGFSALVNYHRLNRQTLEKLTYTTLGWWISRQQDDAQNQVPGAGARLKAAQELQQKLTLILEGEPPFDVYVRWKSLAEQSIGWDPDLDDGVRLNIRPFVTAEVLRSKFTINWNKDRGANFDGTVRHNDLHHGNTEKRTARRTIKAEA